jgi:hypothetical protein
LRPNRLSRRIGLAQANPAPYLARLWPHFWMGHLSLALSLLHASLAMQPKAGTNPVGTLAATAALFLLLGEVVGITLKEDRTAPRRSFRRIHFWIMIGFAGALTIHLWLKGF